MDLYSWDMVGFSYGNQWRRARRLFHEFLNVNAVTNFDRYQHKHAYRFLSRLAETPEDFFDHAKLCVSSKTSSSQTHVRLTSIHPSVTGALIMEIAYGFDVKSHEDKFLQASERAMDYAREAMVPGAFLVDTFPIRSSSFRSPGPAFS